MTNATPNTLVSAVKTVLSTSLTTFANKEVIARIAERVRAQMARNNAQQFRTQGARGGTPWPPREERQSVSVKKEKSRTASPFSKVSASQRLKDFRKAQREGDTPAANRNRPTLYGTGVKSPGWPERRIPEQARKYFSKVKSAHIEMRPNGFSIVYRVAPGEMPSNPVNNCPYPLVHHHGWGRFPERPIVVIAEKDRTTFNRIASEEFAAELKRVNG